MNEQNVCKSMQKLHNNHMNYKLQLQVRDI